MSQRNQRLLERINTLPHVGQTRLPLTRFAQTAKRWADTKKSAVQRVSIELAKPQTEVGVET